MAALPHEPDRVATKDDIGGLRAEIAAQGTELRTEIARLDTRITVLEANLRGEIKAGNSELLRTLFFAMVTSNATLVGLVFAAIRLG